MNEKNIAGINFEEIRTLLLEQAEQFAQKPLGVEREILPKMSELSRSPHAVVISGLRRAGKSTFLAQLARRYPAHQYYFINFEDERWTRFTVTQFNALYELLIELFGDRKIFFLDEVQNIEGWETVVRRFMDQGFKFYITGSNASLLSQELGSRLTGRYLPVELFPFSFREFLQFIGGSIPKKKGLTTRERGSLRRHYSRYVREGGIPDAISYPELEILRTLFRDILYRDIATRYHVNDVKALLELSTYLMNQVGTLVSFNKLKQMLMLGSVNTVKNYILFLETSWLLHPIPVYDRSLKRQQIAPKKIYSIDTGLAKTLSLPGIQNRGRYLENVVFLELRRHYHSIYYYKTREGYEVDFYIPEPEPLLIQVAETLASPDTRTREIRALVQAATELGLNSATIITTETGHQQTETEGIRLTIIPILDWLLTEKRH